MSTPHLGPEVLRAYADGRLGHTRTLSVDQHLIGCPACRGAVGVQVEDYRVERLWAEIREEVETPVPTTLERVVRGLGLDEGTARLVAATPTLKTAWLLGVVLVLTMAAVAAGSQDRAAALFLAFAPVLPVLGVAYAFGPVGDPAHEVVTATPYPRMRLLAIRTAVVVSSTLVPALLLSPLLPVPPLRSVAWLLPALAMAAVTLVLAERVPAHVTATGLVLAWVVLIGWTGVVARDPWFAATVQVQVTSAIVLVAATAVLMTTRLTLTPNWRIR